MQTTSGGCLCRAVRYAIDARPIVTRVCWCRVCQYIGAGSGTVNVCFPSATLTVQGELRDFCLTADSGKCDAPALLPRVRDAPVQLRGGAPAPGRRARWDADDPEMAQRAITIWTSARRAGRVDARLPQLERQPPPRPDGALLRPSDRRSSTAVRTWV